MVNLILTINIILITCAILYFGYQLYLLKKKIRKETQETKESIEIAFERLKQKLEKEIELLDKEPGLSKEEKDLRDKLEEALSRSKNLIKKELKDIEKTID